MLLWGNKFTVETVLTQHVDLTFTQNYLINATLKVWKTLPEYGSFIRDPDTISENIFACRTLAIRQLHNDIKNINALQFMVSKFLY